MLIENSFEVSAPVERVWDYMLDIHKVVVCMPGAELTGTVDERNFKGKLNFKLGPVSLSFTGKVKMTERDDAAHRVVLSASGMEQRGKGAASATVTSHLMAIDGGTRVHILQDIKLQGQAAQFSRGMMQDVSAKLTRQFADCLQAGLAAEHAPEAPADGAAARPQPPDEAAPVKVGALAAEVLWRRLLRAVSRLVRGVLRLLARARDAAAGMRSRRR